MRLLPGLLLAAIGIAAAAPPPLSDAQRSRLETAIDGEDLRDDAFMALVENVRAWPDDVSDQSPAPDLQAINRDPAAHRGKLVRIRGQAQQRTPLPPPYEDASEWFVRLPGGEPVIVYVLGDGGRMPANAQVQVTARFWKTMRIAARDGRPRTYAAFVGSHARLLPAESAAAPSSRLGGFGAVIVFMMLLFVIGGAVARRQIRLAQAAREKRSQAAGTEALDGDPDLPDDPAGAMAELRRRALER